MKLRSCGRRLRVEEGTGAGEGTGGASNEPILEEVHRLEQAGLARAPSLPGQLVAEYRHVPSLEDKTYGWLRIEQPHPPCFWETFEVTAKALNGTAGPFGQSDCTLAAGSSDPCENGSWLHRV